jgi:hypothetical protein
MVMSGKKCWMMVLCCLVHCLQGSPAVFVPASVAVFKAGAAALLCTYAAVETYCRIPQYVLFGSLPQPLPDFNEKDLVVIFPGAGGVDQNILDLEQSIKRADKLQRIKRRTIVYDWRRWRGNLLRASFDSENVGEGVANQLLKEHPDLKSVQAIGVSVGAFAANSCTRILHKKKTSSGSVQPYVRLTLLDPFTLRGVFGLGYGASFFGKSADYCEHYLNTDDPVPSTNEPLPLAHTYDVTTAKSRQSFTPLPNDNMHSWPLVYYAKNFVTQVNRDGSIYQPVHDDSTNRRRGVVVKVP